MSVRRNSVVHKTVIGASILLLALFIITAASDQAQAGKDEFKPHPLTNASPVEVGQAAISYTKSKFPLISGDVHIALIRPVTTAELPGLGFGTFEFGSIEVPPLMLVILKGDFGVGDKLGSTISQEPGRAQYIAHVFDLWAGVPIITGISPRGGHFRKALNDPTLPDDGPVVPNQTSTGDLTPIAPGLPPAPPYPKTMHYGDTAPPVTPPALPIGK